jgi:hypothetical protein
MLDTLRLVGLEMKKKRVCSRRLVSRFVAQLTYRAWDKTPSRLFYKPTIYHSKLLLIYDF